MGKLRKLSSSLTGLVDGAVLSALRYRYNRPLIGPNAAAEIFVSSGGDRDRLAALLEVIAHYERPEVQEAFYAPPALPQPSEKVQGTLEDGGQIVDLAWPSTYQPSLSAFRDEYLAWEANRGVRLRAFLHPRPTRTAIVCIHGYQGGSFFVEERAFQARWLYSRGADVVLFTLPFHGGRADRDAPSWPSPSPVLTNEGFGHAIHDLRALVRWLRARPGAEAQRLAVIGMSLGGYTTALYATVDELDFIAPMIPVASWSELVWAHGEGTPERARAEQEGITLELVRRAMAIVSPLERAPCVDPEHTLVLSAYGDRIAPPEHALRLAEHFAGVHLGFTGGHVLQIGRRDAFVAIAQRMALLGLIDKR